MAKREWDFETGKTTLNRELHPKFDSPKNSEDLFGKHLHR